MKDVLRTSSFSQAESLAIALEAEGIVAVVSNQNLAGVPPAAITVAVEKDTDYDRAIAVLRDLELGPAAPVVRRPSQRLLMLVLTILIAILLTLCLNL